jgi:sphingomyelin phosphodiesterase acid-like 3
MFVSRTGIFAALILVLVALTASAAPAKPANIPALFLSDIHFDPYADPAKVVELNSAPVSEWAGILSAPPSTTQAQDFAALRVTCPVRGVDTPNVLWLSSLEAIHTNASRARFATVSGDLLAHQFDCKYKALLPGAPHADYVNFAAKTIRYIVGGLRTQLPGVPIYVAMGNNDSGCTDYALDPTHDEFLALTAKIVAEALPQRDRNSVLRNFAAGGYYSAPLPAAIPHTRLLVLDDLFLSGDYVSCAGNPDPTPAATQLAWVKSQLVSARRHHEHVWVMAHIPTGVDLYATARKLTNICAGAKPQMFLGSESLAEVLARNSDVVRLAIFGHTHSDEMRLLTRGGTGLGESTGRRTRSATIGVPVKLVASITPLNGNRPTFTLALINPVTATLVDYTVIEASNLTGVDTTWELEYTYSKAYGKPAFDSASLTSLIADFQADPTVQSSASQAYLRNYFPGDISAVIKFVWPQYACSMDHDSAVSFSACACAAAK